MKKVDLNKKSKHKRNKKRKEIAQKSKNNPVVKQTIIETVKVEPQVVKKNKSKLRHIASVALQITLGFVGFLAGGFVIALKLPYLVNLFSKI